MMLQALHTAGPASSPLRQGGWQTLRRAAALFVFVVVASSIPIVHDLQLRLTDSFFRLAPAPKTPSQVVVVLIDEASLQTYGRWPWPRALLAEVNTNLAEAGASAIGFDVLLSEPQTTEADHVLAQSFRSSGRTVIVDKIGAFPEGPRWVGPLPSFAENAAVGHAQAVLDPEGTCRRFPPRELTLDGPRWAFAIEVARRFNQQQTAKFLVQYGLSENDDQRVAVARPVLVRVPFRRDGFHVLSAKAVLERKGLAEVRGRPVLVGFGPAELGDRVATPLSRNLPTPGVEVHAQILDSVLTGRTLSDLSLAWSAFTLFLVSVPIVIVNQRWRGRYGLLRLLVLGAGSYGVAFLVYLYAGLMPPAGTYLMAVMFGPVLVYSADFIQIERTVTGQLLGLRSWLQHRGLDKEKRGLPSKLQTLQSLQAELGALYELHRTLLESTQDLVAIFDEQGRVLLKNQSFSSACPSEIEDLTLDEFLSHLTPRTDGPGTGVPDLESEMYLGGELYSLRRTALPPTFLSPSGGTILTMTSLRAREERDRSRSEALAFVTHELRTPLTAIQGFAELMTRYPGSPSSLSAPETIARESKRLLAMINSYLSILRLDAGAQAIQAAPVDIGIVVQQVLDLLQPLAQASGMRFVLPNAPSAAAAMGDAALVLGAVLNLLSNAIKYGRRDSDIEISWRGQNGEVIIAVQNYGEAVPADSINRLFEPYYRGPHGERAVTGTGLGLAFVKRIAEKHGGTVTARSGQNAMTFEVHFPAAATVVAQEKT